MTWSSRQWFTSSARSIDFLNAGQLVGLRTASRRGGGSSVSREQALRHSAVWACLRLRADLVSTMPVDVFRRVNGVQVELPRPPVLVSPGGRRVRLTEWLYSSQWDLDSCGNAFGLISARDGNGLPAQIDLVSAPDVTVLSREGRIFYRIRGNEYAERDVWHERQYTQPGLTVGLSPIAYAAMSINGYLSAQQFAVDWFTGSATPAQHLKNTNKTFEKKQAYETKLDYESSIVNGGVFVSGADWELNMLSAKASESQFIDERQFGLGDVCRFLGVPGDMIDAPPNGSSVTYANITQRNLQLLIMNLNPALRRREEAFSADLLPQPRYAKFNRGGLLEMDLKSRWEAYKVGVDGRWLPPSRILDLENQPPLTAAEEAEFGRLFGAPGAKAPTPAGQTSPTGVSA